jgi:hypothetical protein
MKRGDDPARIGTGLDREEDADIDHVRVKRLSGLTDQIIEVMNKDL